jgi:3-oxoacyl-[acyl-carrier protein] reductase
MTSVPVDLGTGARGAVAVVTGAAGGIGAEICHTLARRGATVVGVDRVKAADLEREIHDAGGEVRTVCADVCRPEDLDRLAAEVEEEFGRIDVLVNGAAVYRSLWRGEWTDIPVEEWDRTFEVNVRGVWLCCRAVAPRMARLGGGRIVNVSSTSFRKGPVDMVHYAASKAAVCALTSGLARALGPQGIRVNTVLPGLVEDEATLELLGPERARASAGHRALGRNVSGREVAEAVAFLASSESDGLHGTALVVDAGGLCDF